MRMKSSGALAPIAAIALTLLAARSQAQCTADVVPTWSSPYVTPTTVAAGAAVSLSPWTIQNIGTGSTGTSTIDNGFYLSSDTTITTADAILGHIYNGPLAGGASYSFGAPVLTIPPTTAAGTYYIGILVDYLNSVCEVKESNNWTSTPITVQPACKSDLTVSSGAPTVTPATIAQGGTVTVSSWTLKNQGTAANDHTFRSGYYLSPDPIITSADTFLADLTTSSILAGATYSWQSKSLNIPSSTSPGMYYLGILTDLANQTCETNESNNYVSTPLTVTPSCTTSDLTIGGSLIVSPSTIRAGAAATVKAWLVKNGGSGPTGAGFANGIYLSSDAIITSADTLLTGNTNQALAAGTSTSWPDTPITIPSGTTAGTWYIGILADRANEICEADEKNNYGSSAITVTAACTTADLTIGGSPIVSPSTIAAGAGATVKAWSVKNGGTSSTGAGFANGIYLSADAIITSADTLLTGSTNEALAAGAIKNWPDTPITIPSGTSAGTWYVGILADKGSDICETNEQNNYASSAITVAAACTTSDLTIGGSPIVSPSTIAAGAAATVKAWSVKNGGTSSTGAGFANGIYLSSDAIITSADTLLTGNTNQALAAGTSTSWPDTPITIPSGTAAGTWYVGILADRANEICETDEKNNYASSPIAVQDCASDLVISSGRPTVTPATVAPGGSVTLSAWTVKNQGSSSTAKPFNNGFYLSLDPTITSADTYLTGNSNAALAAGSAYSWGSPVLQIPSTTKEGTYYVGILTDRDGGICESNEQNNFVSVGVTVAILKPTISSFNPASGPSGTVVSIAGTNLGGTRSVAFSGVAAGFAVKSDTQLIATVPAGTKTGRITVTTGVGMVTSATDFTIVASPPVVTSFSPAKGPVGTAVSVIGRHLSQAAKLDFGGVAAQFSIASDSCINTKVPSGATTGLITVATASGSDASDTAFTVVVPAASIVVAALPKGLVADAGVAGATDSYVLANRGTAPATITLTQTGSFFTQSPSSFVLDAGATRVVTLTSEARPAGSYEGSSIPSGGGVPAGTSIPVKLVSTAPPPGVPNVKPVQYLVQVVYPLATATISLTNDGDGPATGVLSTDVPWIIPATGALTILPRQTISSIFRIDLQKRHDNAFGSEPGGLSFRYRGSESNARTSPLASPPPLAANVNVVSVIAPPPAAAALPPFSAGETGFFVPAVKQASHTTAKISMSNANFDETNLSLYFVGSSASGDVSRVAGLGVLPANAPKAMFDIVRNVFGQQSTAGTFHVRSAHPERLSLAGLLIDDTLPTGNFGTELSVFHSDRAASAGEDVTLAGLQKSPSSHADLYVQEVSGIAGTTTIEFLDDAGRLVGTARAADNFGAFGVLVLPDAVPSGAVTARINAGATGRFIAEAIEVDESSTDSWNVIDSTRSHGASRTDLTIIPFAASLFDGSRTLQTDLALANPGTTVATVKVEYFTRGAGRRRPVRPATNTSAPESSAAQSVTIGAHGTVLIGDAVRAISAASDSRGYFVVTPVSGQVVATSRSRWSTPGSDASIGTSVPALPPSAAASAGVSRRFLGIEDASASSVSSNRRATYRTSFGLVEAGGAEVTARVTFRFLDPCSLADARESKFRDITVGAREFVFMEDLAEWVIGADRDVLGDIHDADVTVEIVGGSGSVLPFILQTENASGDLIFRSPN